MFRARLRCLQSVVRNGSYRNRSFNTSERQGVTNKPFYVTTPIFYPNGNPHIGHLYSLVTADVFARYARLRDPARKVVFVTGTDEHGLKIQKAAKDLGMGPQEFCDERSALFQELTKTANISCTTFLRTSSDLHKQRVQYLWIELFRRGLIYKGTHSGWYSITDECFYTDAQISKTVDPISGKECSIANETGSEVEWSSETNYKFRLSKFRDGLLKYFEDHPEAIYPHSKWQDVKTILLEMGRGSVADLSISRPATRLSWGIPVPGDTSQTIYVWLDALTSYLSAIEYPAMQFSQVWPADIQVIGKDILRFHAVYFPAFLTALNIPLSRKLLTHAHWTVNQSKMSKSVGNVVNPFSIIKFHGVDTVRWYLMRVGGRFKDDVDWSNEQLEKYEEELRSVIGNLLLRIQSPKIVERLPVSDRTIPLYPAYLAIDGTPSQASERSQPGTTLQEPLGTLRTRFDDLMRNCEVAEALQVIVDCLTAANKELTLHTPWSKTTSIPNSIRVLSWTRETLRICGIVLQPFMPSTSSALLDALCVSPTARSWDDAKLGSGDPSPGAPHRVSLFPRKEARSKLAVESDHRDEPTSREAGRVPVWAKVHRGNSGKRTARVPNALYQPLHRQGVSAKRSSCEVDSRFRVRLKQRKDRQVDVMRSVVWGEVGGSPGSGGG